MTITIQTTRAIRAPLCGNTDLAHDRIISSRRPKPGNQPLETVVARRQCAPSVNLTRLAQPRPPVAEGSIPPPVVRCGWPRWRFDSRGSSVASRNDAPCLAALAIRSRTGGLVDCRFVDTHILRLACGFLVWRCWRRANNKSRVESASRAWSRWRVSTRPSG